MMYELLIVTPFFPPSAASGSFRALGFAKHLPKCGWGVTVVTSGPRPWESEDPELTKDVPSTTRVHYVDFPLGEFKRIVPRALQKIGVKGASDVWNAPAFQKCREVVRRNRPDVVLTSGPPHNVHLLGRALQKYFDLPWVADFRDPWCSWGDEVPYVDEFFFLERWWERTVFRTADAVVANTQNTAEVLRQVFPLAASRITSVPNGYDPMHLDAAPVRPRDDSSFTLLHTGAVYAGRNPRPVIEALGQIAKGDLISGKSPILRLFGKCFDPKLRDDVAKGNLQRWVDFGDSVPYLVAAKAARAADLLVLLDSPGRRIGVPAKLYEYVGAGRPILAMAEQDSDSAHVLRKSGLPHRVVSDYDDVAGVRKAIIELANSGQAGSQHGNGEFLASLTRAANAKLLADVLDDAISRKSAEVTSSLS